MQDTLLVREGRQVILRTEGRLCRTKEELVRSPFFEEAFRHYLEGLEDRDSTLIEELGPALAAPGGEGALLALLQALLEAPLAEAARLVPGAEGFAGRVQALSRLIEGLYDFWRSYHRFLVTGSLPGPEGDAGKRPYRTFNSTVDHLTQLVRSAYRDIAENATGDHPRVFRQVAAGCNVGLIAAPRDIPLPYPYRSLLEGIPVISHVWIDPPLILDPPMNRRDGQFLKVGENPVKGLSLNRSEWLCYPARVGPLTVLVYFHQRFIGLGCSLANLFELVPSEELPRAPDAVFLYGVPAAPLARFGEPPTVYHQDPDCGLLVGMVPGEDRFGYFGYLKKMALTLHNAAMMRAGRMPFHGAMTRLVLRGGKTATVLIIGDTATGKSETLEALRVMGDASLRDISVVADDMGSLALDPAGPIRGYGTETGAFVRLDDLSKGFAFAQVDRAIFMSPHKVNGRVVLPVTTLAEVLAGYPVDLILYADNHQPVDESHPALERFATSAEALAVFREGAALSKGTTSSSGLTRTYFANPFGAPQDRERHDTLAEAVFARAFATGLFVGRLRTRLALPGWESEGPAAAARALLGLIGGGEAP